MPSLAKFARPPVWSGVLMGVDQELDPPIGDLLDRRHDLFSQRRELGVDHEHPVGADQRADYPALALERVEVVGELGLL